MLNQERLREVFDYDPNTGRLIRKNPRKGEPSVTEARSKQGYLIRYFDGKLHTEHKMVYVYHHGYAPKEIDHINRVKDDNRIENLRECVRSQNNGNQKLRGNNTSGYRGVSYSKCTRKWWAQINYGGVHHNLGYYATPGEAALVYNDAAREHFGEFAHQNVVFPEWLH